MNVYVVCYSGMKSNSIFCYCHGQHTTASLDNQILVLVVFLKVSVMCWLEWLPVLPDQYPPDWDGALLPDFFAFESAYLEKAHTLLSTPTLPVVEAGIGSSSLMFSNFACSSSLT